MSLTKREGKAIEAAIHLARRDDRITSEHCRELCAAVERETIDEPSIAELNRQDTEQSDRDRGEIIKRAMMALERAGIPNDVGDPDEMNMLASRITEVGKMLRKELRRAVLILGSDDPTAASPTQLAKWTRMSES